MRKNSRWIIPLIIVISLVFFLYWQQKYWVHTDVHFVPDYPRVVLTEETDYETFFRQTGLGRNTVDKLLAEGDFQTILDVQEAFFQPAETVCMPLLGWFTREDRLDGGCDAVSVTIGKNNEVAVGPELVDLQPGDIILTLSTHSLGWRHGHVGLVMNEETVLECAVWGTDSDYGEPDDFCTYSNYCVLRVRDITPELQEAVTDYADSNLHGVSYHLTAGLIGEKAPDPDAGYFGLQCAYLAWYAWHQFGYDLDGDGGRLVTAHDLLQCGQLEVVQMFGMDPKMFVFD